MAPKHAKPKAKAAAASAQLPEVTEPRAEDLAVNQKHLAELQDALTKILSDRDLQNIREEKPLEIGHGAALPGFNAAAFKNALGADGGGCYKCSHNFFSHDISYSARARIPILETRVHDIMERDFAKPTKYPRTITIAVDTKDAKPLDHLGSWLSVEAEEYRHAYVMAIARDVKAGKRDVVKAWRPFILSAEFEFIVLEGEIDRYYAATNKRERIADEFEFTRVSVYQRVEEIYAYKRQMEESLACKLSSDKVETMYNQHIRLAKKSDPVNKSFVDMAITIHERALSLPEVATVVRDIENLMGSDSPFSKITVLHAFVTKGRTKDNIIWAFSEMCDHLKSTELRSSDLAVRTLLGDAGSRGFIDLMLMHKAFKEHLLGPVLTEMGVDPNIIETLRKVLGSHAAYRENLSPLPNSGGVANTSWQAGWQLPLLDYVAFVEACVFKLRASEYDHIIRAGVRNRKHPVDILEYEVMKEKWGDLKQAVANMVSEQAAAAGPAGCSSATDLVGHEAGEVDAATEPQKGTKRKKDTPNAANPVMELLKRDLPEDKVGFWAEMVNRTYTAHVTLITEPSSGTALREQLKDMDVCKLNGSAGSSYVGFFYNFSQACESVTAPHRRTAPYQEAHATKCIQAALEARSGSESKRAIMPGDMYFINDCGKNLVGNKIVNLFKNANDAPDGERPAPLRFKQKTLFLSYNEKSIRDTRKNTRSFTGIRQIEQVHVLTLHNIDLPSKPRKHFAGTNQGQTIENIILPHPASQWTLDFKTKKAIYGTRRVRVGGPDPDANSDDASSDGEHESKRTDDSKEAVFFKTLPRLIIQECVHSFGLTGIVDMTAGDGEKAMAAVVHGILYAGVCLSDTHMLMLKGRIQEDIYKGFCTEGHPLFKPQMADIIKKEAEHRRSASNPAKKPKNDTPPTKPEALKKETVKNPKQDSSDSDSQDE